MSEEQAIRDAMEAWSERGIDGLLELVAPDVEWHAPPGFTGGRGVARPRRGRAGAA